MTRPAPRRRALAAPAVLAATALVVAGCSSGDAAGEDDARLDVLASFYPLQYVAEQVGGEHVEVANLTPPAAEPHDLELAPAQVREIGEADLVVYLSGFQNAVDEGVEQREPAHVVDAAGPAGLEAHPDGAGHEGESAQEHAEHAEEEHDEDGDDDHEHGAADPHFWLDPTRLAAVGDAVADELSAVDPDHAEKYRANAEALTADLDALDAEYAEALAPCAGATLVTSHEAFGYLAERYDLHQVGISGIDPEAEPSPARLREVRDVVQGQGVTTLFFETLVSPKVTQTLADDLGVDAAVLDPLEGLAEGATDYREVMESNLDALTSGLACA
ncbi:metal ABC transporter substrate-binding protein [Cellulosimicrobium sp. CUA-896]|uniref:metal ABC transporter substrate-binding protein n=1 Tax=Cellulosimicrobium sp. CUA-896 TaxID=1517881 RepID=UPI0009667B50|nr:metal ABC transporter substrate-binding protein [Cellulosimicrobium sp. CUA-896]OLT54008.1 ABC transporter substrate-binding protein [Cellulosimicrobium sp. CUA-896]